MTCKSENEIPAGMKPWRGGASAPADWDGGPVLRRHGGLSMPEGDFAWTSNDGGLGNVIAYTPDARSAFDAGFAAGVRLFNAYGDFSKEGDAAWSTYAPAATPKPPAGGDEWSMVNRLRDQEADSVEILCDNPDGDPNNAIVCCGFWTGFVERRFSGDTIADALRSAVKAKDQADRDGHPDVSPAGGDAGAVERAYRQGQIDMRDRAAAVCDERGAEEQEGYGLNRAAQNYFRARNAVRALEPAALALPAPVVEGDVEKEAQFLCDRLAEFEREIIGDDLFTQFNAHVAPSVARLRAALSEGRSHG